MLVLSWCARPWWSNDSKSGDIDSQNAEEKEKTAYYVQVDSLADLSKQPTLLKTWKLTWESDVVVTSQSSWRVSQIFYDEWENPPKWGNVISLVDSNNLYNFSISRWKESVEAAKINYESTKVTIDNTLIDLELAVKRSQQQYDLAVKDADQTYKDNQQQLLDIDKQIADNKLQLLDDQQQIRDSELQLLDAEQQIRDSEQQRILAEYSARTNDPDDPMGSASLSLKKFDSDIEKAEFDYQTKLDADQQTLEWFVNSVEVIQDTILNVFETTLDWVDKILWVTEINKTNNDSYEQFLWAQDTQTRFKAEQTFRNMLWYRFQLANFELNTANIDQMPAYLRELDSSLSVLDGLLNEVERMLGKTITWNIFPQSQLDWLKAQIDWFQAQTVAQAWSIVQQINAIDSFLATYLQNQTSLRKQIEILKEQRLVTEQQLRDAAVNADIAANRADIWGERIDIAANRANISGTRTDIAVERSVLGNERKDISLERTKIALERANLQAKNAVEQALLNLESARNALEANNRTRNLSLRGLQNSIDQAQVWYSEALTNSSKLSVKATINGTIWEIFVDVGEEISPWTPLFSLTTTDKQEVTISLSSEEKDQVFVWTKVQVTLWEDIFAWKIISISDIADDQLLYKTIIILDQLSDRLWEIVDVEIPLTSAYTLLPLQAIKMETTKQWLIWVWNGEEPEQVKVDLWDVWWANIEIRNSIWNSLDVITSPMNNYDSNIHDAQIKTDAVE